VAGHTTYGKGLIQGVFGLTDGGALIETVASYSTPSRTEINQRGVAPDEERAFASDVASPLIEVDLRAAPAKLQAVCKDGGAGVRAAAEGMTEWQAKPN
jgi:C-terminal processing protease CtpA/Prc